MLFEKVAHGPRLRSVLDLTEVAIVDSAGHGLQFRHWGSGPNQPEVFGALVIVETHPRRLQFLIGSYSWRAAVRRRFGKKYVVSRRVTARWTFVQQIQIAVLWTGEIDAKLPTVLEDFLARRLELILKRLAIAHFLHSERVGERTF